MGTKELASGKGPNSVSLKFQEIITMIRQKATSVRICVSTCIPRHQSQTSKINKEILQYNESLRDIINTLNRKNGDSILISENEFLQRFLAHSCNNRDLIQLTEHGEYKLYIRMKYVLFKASRTEPRNLDPKKNPEEAHNE